MSSRIWIVVLLGWALAAAACPADDDDGGMSDDAANTPDDPVAYYGPCTDNPYCGMGSGLGTQSDDGTCTCTVFCEEDVDCPMPGSGTSVPFCELDDLVINGMNGECKLACDDTQTCPDEMACQNGRCRFAG
jgi:hypothetical protein